jgi:hypothetical protein
VRDLQPLPLGFLKAFVVGHGLDERAYAIPKGLLEFIGRGLGVLERVMEQGSHKDVEVVDSTYGGGKLSDPQAVIDVRARLVVLAALGSVLLGRERCGAE